MAQNLEDMNGGSKNIVGAALQASPNTIWPTHLWNETRQSSSFLRALRASFNKWRLHPLKLDGLSCPSSLQLKQWIWLWVKTDLVYNLVQYAIHCNSRVAIQTEETLKKKKKQQHLTRSTSQNWTGHLPLLICVFCHKCSRMCLINDALCLSPLW